MIDKDIKVFVDSVGAKDPYSEKYDAEQFRKMFKRRNYFVLDGRFLIIKISRSHKPFWGVGKKFIDFLNNLQDYSVVVLSSRADGWVFSKNEVNNFINSRKWVLCEGDQNYKINMPLPDTNYFSSVDKFRVNI